MFRLAVNGGMSGRRQFGLVAALLGLLVFPGPAGAATPLQFTDLQGVRREPLEFKSQKAVVFFFLLQDCPICNAYSAEIGRIIEKYSPQNVDFYAVQIDPDLSPDEARRHARDFAIKCPVLLDRRHELVRAAKAVVTPEAAVFIPGGRLVYRGRIDDTFLDFGKRRESASVHDLRAALDAVLDGRPVEHPVTQAVGCYISTKNEGK